MMPHIIEKQARKFAKNEKKKRFLAVRMERVKKQGTFSILKFFH